MLTSILPPSVCASCRLCCHFLPESTWETPALEEDCAQRLLARGVSLVERPEGGLTLGLTFASECPQGAANCPLLDVSAGCRLLREERPLECRLWPLRLMRDESGRVVVACYNSCPGLSSCPREQVVELARALQPLLRERARSFPQSIRDLHPRYQVLFGLEDSPSLPSGSVS